jgi:hypothetical protein
LLNRETWQQEGRKEVIGLGSQVENGSSEAKTCRQLDGDGAFGRADRYLVAEVAKEAPDTADKESFS